jgi:PAT family beta-lactamase induction signal transducer AmpG
MALVDPREHLEWIALLALLVAFSSATQDINIDAYRIEAAEPEFQGAMASRSSWRGRS